MQHGMSMVPEATKRHILEVLDKSRHTIDGLVQAHDAALRLHRHASLRATEAEDRIERITLMLATALGHPTHAGQTPEAMIIEVEKIMRGLRGDL